MPRVTGHGIYSPPLALTMLRGGPTPPGDACNPLSLQPPGGRPDAGVAELAAGPTPAAAATLRSLLAIALTNQTPAAQVCGDGPVRTWTAALFLSTRLTVGGSAAPKASAAAAG